MTKIKLEKQLEREGACLVKNPTKRAYIESANSIHYEMYEERCDSLFQRTFYGNLENLKVILKNLARRS